MWVVYTFIGYMLLALVTPLALALWPTWRKASVSREVTCPAAGAPALVSLDPWFAVRMHALGNSEVRVKDCVRWPECRQCGRECLAQIGAAA